MKEIDKSFWENRYINNDIGWDIGRISTPIQAYIDQLQDKTIKILIPGGGHSYEAEYLFNKGFKNVFVVDISKTALKNVLNRVPNFPKTQLLNQNFFDLDMSFDLIIEQTFFCAINPSLRSNYALKMCKLLNPKGKLIGLLFNIPLNNDKPPFGGNKKEYITYFEPYFNIAIMELCYNSIPQRQGNELFIKLIKL